MALASRPGSPGGVHACSEAGAGLETPATAGLEASATIAYLSFSVVKANNAKISEAIQKRTMTLDSDQPSNSK